MSDEELILNKEELILSEKIMRIQEYITDTIKEQGSISQFKEDVIDVIHFLLEKQLTPVGATATEIRIKHMEYEISKQKEIKYEERLEKYKNENQDLKEQIKDLRKLNVQHLAKGLNESIANKNKNDEQLEALNEGWKITENELNKELETKDKIIDLMAEILSEFDFDKMCGDCPCDYCTAREDTDEYMDCIKEYFRNKVLNNE